MMTLVSYDVSTVDAAGRKRLRKVAKECVNYGQRVQNSVFEVDVDYGTFLKLKDRLMKIIDEEQDSLRFYEGKVKSTSNRRVKQYLKPCVLK